MGDKVNRIDNNAVYQDQIEFQKIFGKNASQAIKEMDGAGDDIASQAPSVGIDINEVGCIDKKTYFKIEDPLSKESVIRLYSSINVGIKVDQSMRGIHVSRLNDSIARISEHTVFKSINEFALNLARDIKQTQHASWVNVKLEADYISPADVKTVEGKPTKRTQDHFKLIGKAVIFGKEEHISAGIEVNHITSCPCVQQTVKHATAMELDLPLFTHSQRSITRIILNDIEEDIDFSQLLKSIDSCVFMVRDTLPRPGEAALVYRSHENPQFIEDVVRLLSQSVFAEFGFNHPTANITINSRSMESIHSFDIIAQLNVSFKKMNELGISSTLSPTNPKRVITRWNTEPRKE